MTSKTDKKKTADKKRAKLPRDSKKMSTFLKDWERLSRSGKHDMNVLKQAMMLLIANDAPLPPEWKDHQLSGELQDFRECHVKGDLLLVYRVYDDNDGGVIMFHNARTHSELF
ncbi:MAG: type II toxin-antitoxin system YafQ family toxin [Synergistaceae bacterium]|nr:type II toxin-antitoxin system YafQ family toxin [Synergistaceae bacterium]